MNLTKICDFARPNVKMTLKYAMKW